MKTITAAFALAAPLALVGTAAPSTASAPAESIAGDWKLADGRSVIRLYRCGDAMCGKIQRILVAQPAGGARDTKNPDASKRDRKLIGLTVFWNLKPSGNAYKGKGYNPDDGRNFNAKFERKGSQLRLKGCVAIICRTQMLTKA